METLASSAEVPVASPTAPLSVWKRAAAVFTRPAAAWSDLGTRTQWWFPMTLMALAGAAFTLVLHERAILPMITQRWEQMVDSGQLSAEQLERMSEGLKGPAGLAISVAQQFIVWPVILFALALLVWFGAGFVLGTKLRYRHGLEIAAWSSLIHIPAQLLIGVLAWSKQTLSGIHVGLAILLPEAEAPTKLQAALASFLDALGPFQIWSVAVVVIGAAALSGAPRRSVAWVMSGLYLGLSAFLAALAALFAPGT
ncbi:MAG TPA: YIP1 family protein [Candidatus Eisenbacteria bacterium]